ncbi:hypothetical protein Q7P37_001053 [Cladosporium fusiforme]
MRRSLRYRPIVKRILQLAGILILVQSIVDYRRSRATYIDDPIGATGEKIFIASIHWNNEKILRSHWVPGVLDLVKHFGEDNVYVSVQESGSWDDSKGALRELDQALEKSGVRRKIILDDTTHEDEIKKTPAESGWIQTPRGQTELRRVPYLARLRNLVLEPLQELAEAGEKFDKILFINDVVFNTQDVQRLFETRGGDYAAACSLDFSKPPAFYDTFALRDSEGHDTLMQSWPYFRSRASRDALKASQPVPVTSCWNGIVVMNAEPFYSTINPLRFRGTPDSLAALHLEGSECCLIHTDNPLSASKGVWLNPNVRVGYNARAYDMVNPYGTRANAWVGTASVLHGSWENRLLRWLTMEWFDDNCVRRRIRKWQGLGDERVETGAACLINEMQVLIANGWAHV